MTVSDSAPPDAAARGGAAVAGQLPVTAIADRAQLIEFDGVAWRERTSLPLGPPP